MSKYDILLKNIYQQEGEPMNLKNSRFEWMCAGSESGVQKFIRILAQCACILFGLMSIFSMWYLPFVIITAISAIVWVILFRNRKTEYEFEYFAGELVISKISNAARRKKKFTCNLDQISYIRKGQDENAPTKKFYFNPQEIYTMPVSNSAGENVLWIEADERFIQVLDQEKKLRK